MFNDRDFEISTFRYFDISIFRYSVNPSVKRQAEQCGEQQQHADNHHDYANNLVNQPDTVHIEARAYLIYNIGEAIPPKHGSEEDADISKTLLTKVLGNHKREGVEQSDEEEDDQGVAEGEQERSEEIVRKRAATIRGGTQLRTRTVGVHTKDEQHHTTNQLQDVNGTRLFDEFHHETHAQTSNKGIEDIADGGSKSRDQTILPTLVQSALNTQHTNRSHRGTCHYSDNQALDGQIQ